MDDPRHGLAKYQPLLSTPQGTDLLPTLKSAFRREDIPCFAEGLNLLSKTEKISRLEELLIWAVGEDKNAVSIVKLLLDHGANPNHISKSNPSALSVAASRSDSTDILELLLDAGAKIPNSKALHSAAEFGVIYRIRVLWSRKVLMLMRL